MRPVEQPDHRRIEDRHRRADGLWNGSLHRKVGLHFAQNAQLERVGGYCGAGSDARRAGRIRHQRALRSANSGGSFGENEWHAAQRPATARAQHIAVRHREAEPLQLDVEIVFDRQSECIRKRKVEVPGANQPPQPRRVFEAYWPATHGAAREIRTRRIIVRSRGLLRAWHGQGRTDAQEKSEAGAQPGSQQGIQHS